MTKNACIHNALNFILHVDILGPPQMFKILNSSSSSLTLTWSPPSVSEIYGQTISTYDVSCSTSSNDIIIKHTDIRLTTFFNLHPFTSYNCCVAAVGSYGRGKLACVDIVTSMYSYTLDFIIKPLHTLFGLFLALKRL